MTLLELANLLKPKLKLMLIVSILCGLLVFAGSYLLISNTYQATATMVVNVSTAPVKGYADSAATSAPDGVTITTAISSTDNSISITAKGKNADECIKAVNNIMADTERLAKENLGSDTTTVNTKVTEASSVKNVTPKRYLYGIVAFFAVLLVFIAWYVFQDSLKRRIHSWTSVQEAFEIPCIGELGGTMDNQEKLFAMARFVGRDGQDAASSVCFVPVGNTETASKAAHQLRAFNDNDVLKVYSIKPSHVGADAMIFARDVDTVLLAVQQEQSTFTEADSLVHELTLVGAKPAGFVYETTSGSKMHKQNKKKSQDVQ